MEIVGNIGFMILFVAVMLAAFGRFDETHTHTRAHAKILSRRRPRR